MGFVTTCLIWQSCASLLERFERKAIYNQAAEYSNLSGKPLIVVGGTKGEHGAGDLCIDLNPESCKGASEFLQADIRNLPFPDKFAGAAFASHVLEHLATVKDAQIALAELNRVADRVYVLYPHKWNIAAWLHPEHNLWVNRRDNYIVFEQRAKY